MQDDFEIVTDRLILRTARMEDAQDITRAKQEVWSDLQAWMSWAVAGENTLESTQNYIRSANGDGSIPLIARCKESGKFVLATGLMLRDGAYETGYWIAKEFLGKGLATEATNATIRFAFDKLRADRVTIGYFEGNEKSRRIIEKLGFTKTRTLEKSHARCSNGELLDEHQFEMTDPSVLPPLEVEWRRRCP